MFSTRPRLILAAAMVTALCLACIRLGERAIWIDEAITFYIAHQPIPEFAVSVRGDWHPFLHYLVMWVWLKFGDSEFWFRFSSVLCFVFTVPVVYVMARTVGGCRAGLTAAWLAATAPFLIRYAQEARMYLLLTLFCSLALMCAVLIISRQSDRPPVIGSGLWSRLRQSGTPSSGHGWGDDLLWGLYIISALGAMLTQHTSVLLPVIMALIFLVAIAVEPRFRWRRLRNLIIANAAILALYASSIPELLANFNQAVTRMPPQLLPWRVRMALLTVYGNEHLHDQAAVMVALSLIALWGWRRRKDWRWIGFALIGSIALPLTLAVLALVSSGTIFQPRVFIWAAIPFIVTCAAGIARLPWASLRRVVLVGLLLGNLYGVLNAHLVSEPYLGRRPEPWHRVAQSLAGAVADDGAVLLCPHYIVVSFNYYWRRHPREQVAVFSGKDMAVVPILASAHGQVLQWRLTGTQRSPVSLLDDYAELWIVNYPSDNPACVSPALRDALAERGRLVAERDFGRIKLLGWVRAE